LGENLICSAILWQKMPKDLRLRHNKTRNVR